MQGVIDIQTYVPQFVEQWKDAVEIWRAGGWAMIAIAAIALAIFALGTHVALGLSRKGFRSVPEKEWRNWVNHPEKRKGAIGKLLDLGTGGTTLKETAVFFEELHATEVAPFERDLRVMKIFVTTAPLVGLLGTVAGMLATFAALASGSGGEKTMGLVAKGISEALITTETGLVIALPGLFFQYQLVRQLERYKTFLAHIETVCIQKLYKRRKKLDKRASVTVPSTDVERPRPFDEIYGPPEVAALAP